MWTRLQRAARARLRRANDSGAMSIEKIMIIALIALPILIALVAFRNTIKGWFNDKATEINAESGKDPGSYK